ncbi:APC family permease [Agromyces sp. MMS24-K17]|uniref:APC family permease n=1 Tax=Agromyces sp. MMS24-K17 TaxID=3372850 RepID=UPI0037544482
MTSQRTAVQGPPATVGDPGAAADPAVRRGGLGLGQGTALYVASVLGTGILALPGLAAAAAGPASIVAVAAVLLLSIPLAGTFAALASRYPDPGGVASYVRRALGDTMARMAGYWFYFGVCVGAPVVAVLGGEYVVAVLGVDRAAVPVVGFAIFVAPYVANWFGVRVAGWVQFVLTGLLLAVVIGVVAVTFPSVEASSFEPFLPHGWAGVGTAISLFVWAFAGWEVGTHIAGEFANPRRTIPIATAIAIVVVGLGYLALQVVTVGVLGDRAGEGVVPLLSLVEATAPGIGPALVAIVAAIVTTGVLNAYLAAFGKLGAALGRDGDLPRWFAKGAEDGAVPRRALLLTGALIVVYFGLMLWNGLDLTSFILIHTSNMVAIYAAGMLAATLLLRRWSMGWWLAVVATVLTAGLLVLAWQNLVVPLVLAVAAIAVTVIRRIRSSRATARATGRAERAATPAPVPDPSQEPVT